MAREQHQYSFIVRKINQLEKEMRALKEGDFIVKTKLFKIRLQKKETLNALLPEAFALMREAARRTLGLRAYDVQLLGAIAAHYGNIVEMKTGEGKTLTILFPAFLNALEEKGVHVITANDYLAKRDALWMKKAYNLLGISVNYITSETNDFDRQVAYASDISYVTSNEVCFDFLKDNMIYDERNKRHRGFHYAIIDEADSVLIDEAQIPLVISDAKETPEKDKEIFRKLNGVIKQLKKNIDFKIDKKSQGVYLTIAGIKKLEQIISVQNLYSEENSYIYYIECLLKAHFLFAKDKDYVIDGYQIVIVDEFTGRLMHNHRYYQGIHQAIEVKEGLEIQNENEVLALTTFQHFFRNYEKITGLTGTAKTAEKEFRLLYSKKVFEVPTNKPVIRTDAADKFFLSWEDKLNYLAWATQEYFFKNRAVLIGTRSVRKSRQVHEALVKENIPSNVLNAKNTAREAEVISQAGRPQIVTVATNMAGRGTDIELEPEVKNQGGLLIYGTERHNARRIDNQLIGRAGRQGDPGESLFLISADDELINVYFRREYEIRMKKIKGKETGVKDKKLGKILSRAQKRMENIFFDQRVLNFELDKILEKQRKDFYRQREQVLKSPDLRKITLLVIQKQLISEIRKKYRINNFVLPQTLQKIKKDIETIVNNGWFQISFPNKKNYSIIEIADLIKIAIEKYYRDFENFHSRQKTQALEKTATLKIMDMSWIEHLKKVEQEQDSAMITSINDSEFFEKYEVAMDKLYQNLLQSLPRIISRTFFKIINNLWSK